MWTYASEATELQARVDCFARTRIENGVAWSRPAYEVREGRPQQGSPAAYSSLPQAHAPLTEVQPRRCRRLNNKPGQQPVTPDAKLVTIDTCCVATKEVPCQERKECIHGEAHSRDYVLQGLPSHNATLRSQQLLETCDCPSLHGYYESSTLRALDRRAHTTMSSSAGTRIQQGATRAAQKVESAASEAVNNPVQAKNDFLHLPMTRAALPFVNGGLAGMFATACIQPIDMVKVRLQLAGEGVKTGPKPTPITVTKEILAQGKFLDLYTGLSAGLLRQAVYTTARLGIFDTFQNTLAARAEANGTSVTFLERAGAGLSAGGLAAMIGNPADLALIRMQSDGLKPKDQRANYRSVFDALKRIAAAEGVTALWAGATPTIIRAMALNFGQLTFFAESKTQLKQRAPNLTEGQQRFGASAIAGFFASFFSLPFDFIKTRLQKQSRGPDGKLPYKGFVDCAKKVIRDEGMMRFYRGFSTYYVRIAPHAMITLIVADYLKLITT